MGRKREMCDPFGAVVAADLAIRRWRRVGAVIRRELGLGPLCSFDPGLSFYEKNRSINIEAVVFRPLYYLCLEAQRLRGTSFSNRSRNHQRILDNRAKRARDERLIEKIYAMEAQLRSTDPGLEQDRLRRRIEAVRKRLYDGFRVQKEE